MKTAASRATNPVTSVGLSAAESAFLSAAVEEGIRIQPRFLPEPLLARTGRGHMAPAGVAEIARLKTLPVKIDPAPSRG
jgi:hypothetical protein